MASVWAPEAFALFSGNGTADGFAVVADNAAFYPGAEVFLSSDNEQGQRAIVTELSGSDKIGIRFVGEFPNRVPSYGRNALDVRFTTALHAAISQPAQPVSVERPTFSKLAKV